MKNIRILWILIKFMITYLSIIDCNATDGDLVSCQKESDRNEFQCSVNGWTYHVPKNVRLLSEIEEIRVTSEIGSNTIKNFVFSNEFPSLKTLKLDLPVKNISIEPYAFANFTNLKEIEINSAFVLLHVDSFKRMPKLKSLKLQIVNSTTANLIAVLKNHPSLANLELLNHYTVDICNYQNNDNPLQLLKLQYTGGHLKTLSNGCFKCLKYLTELIITKSNLTTLKAGIFDGLDDLITVSLVLNKQLTHIPSRVFNLKSLSTINLSYNSIKTINNRAFNLAEDNKLTLLNISYNQLEYIGWKMFENIKCDLIDLSRNNIQFIEDNAFKESRIDIIFLFDNSIFNIKGYTLWGLQNKTIVFFDSRPDDIVLNPNENAYSSYAVHNHTHCYSSKYNYFKICKTSNLTSLSLVMAIGPHQWQPNILEIHDNEISSIEEHTFVNITITTLMITSTAKNFTVGKKSFEGLSNLKYLELKTQPIQLNSHFLNHFELLVTLEISATDSERCNCKYTCELVKHTNIKNLLISDAERIAICNRDICMDRNTKILSLRYSHGWFTSLQQDDFVCLKKLEYLGITNSSLKGIKPGSFLGLDELTSLVLSSNKLTQIDRNTFENLTNLNSLILRDNKIINIVNGAFRGKILSMLDLSYNELTSISEDLFVDVIIKQLDLSNNKLITIEIGAFKNIGAFETLNVDNNDELEGNIGIWTADETRIQANCFTQAFFKICTKLNSLSSVNVVVDKFIIIMFLPDFLLPSRKLELFDISSINRNAFKYSNVRSHFETLTIHYTGSSEFMIFQESFEGLINLENLILNVGAIKLKKNLFVELKSLKYLKIEVIETSYCLSQVLTDLRNLKTLQIVGNHSVGICQNSFSKDIPNSIIDIRYTTGTINRLKENSLICVQQIEVFTITKTQLSTIEAGAFNLLNNLRYINLSFNKIFLVSMNVFNNLKSLAVLLLNNNEIEDIDDEAFMLFDNKNFVLYNLSHNELTTIEENTFDSIKSDQLDLSYNKIRSIEAGAFTDSNIKDLYLFSNIDIYKVKRAWNVSSSTIVHIKTSVFFEMYCLSNQKTESVISCEACPSMCIPLKYFYPPRLG